ncbi:MAG: hypothetical protein NT034_03015 [Candidatus Magasanikbacteria bacterium]|nr:hypothetical protein [Candidatus Magasanikbacteria bacterium]
MKNTSKVLIIAAIVAICIAATVAAEAANKPAAKTTKNIKSSVVQVVKKILPKKKVISQPVKKQPAPKPILKPIPKPTPTTTPTPPPTIPPTSTPPAPTTPSATNYPWHDNILATQFYIGETGPDNTTAWDCHAIEHFGGTDSPFGRSGYLPTFTPKENPFYLALPYTDIGDAGSHKTDIPWYNAALDKGDGYSFVKNRWIEMKRGDKVCYGQWEDSLTPDILDANGKRTGYGQPNHFDYVFGNAAPTHPGIDVSPALSTCLGMYDASDKVYAHSDAEISWKFVNENEVPSGAWKNIITATPVSWNNCK